MTQFSKMMLTGLINVMQWVIDNDPAPQVDAKLAELGQSLDDETEPLAAAVAANQPQ